MDLTNEWAQRGQPHNIGVGWWHAGVGTKGNGKLKKAPAKQPQPAQSKIQIEEGAAKHQIARGNLSGNGKFTPCSSHYLRHD